MTSISGTTATFNGVTSAGYKLSADSKSVLYTKATTQNLATVTGICKGATSDDFYLDTDARTITISAAALSTGTVRLKGSYQLEIASDAPTEPEEKFAWTKSSTTATLKEVIGEYYTMSDDARSINYTAAKPLGTAIATVKGVKTALNEDNFDSDNNTIILNGIDLNSKVTVSSDGYTFEFAEDYSTATISGSAMSDTLTSYGDRVSISGNAGNDEISVFGLNVTINGGKGDDTLYGGGIGDAVFVYANGDGHDVIANFTAGDTIQVTSGKVKISTDGADTTLKIGTGSITLMNVDNIASVSVVDKKGRQLNPDYDADFSASYWFEEFNFAQDELTALSSSNSSLGNQVDLTNDSAAALLPKSDEIPAVAYSHEK